ncbi:flagellum-specific ATP synthase [Rhodobium orientis]|uniref:Flagellum-specific ATP synthase n=1 Tax=Rhodobium orientis TaxID=34017 RepID=A0A327JHG6_9HYPH|nr:flagellar protein export ATPase FliI [Rhodobium orientis]MBB4303058.1 flagellum-specific ATP synthase [Rhodobium orientis]MBK5948310.1 flagellum-specific ATP synthase FliI [Rhodobium orientis]RAI25146.1 flagellum-specific ATP synthase FliI [Rhodobium orientis]
MDSLIGQIESLRPVEIFGRVVGVQGLLVEVAGPLHQMGVGARLAIETAGGAMQCEVVGFRGERALCLPFGRLEGVRMGCRAIIMSAESSVLPSTAWLGRVVNAFGEPIDGKGPIGQGEEARPLRAPPPPAHDRARVGAAIDLGVRALNTFVTCCRGQRMGVFAGSGVGKSVLLSMLARNTAADVSVIGLIGERGREVQEFLEDDLGEEGIARSVVVVATSDESALMRRQAAYLTLTMSEFFRDEGKDVLCLMDSVTRFAQAQREIGLAAGEPPTSKGYTPTVFSELPRLLERAGPGRRGSGTVTGLFTVLVEGDNHNEPIADAVRGILDGHIVMERSIAERGRYPAINVLKSVSRTLPKATPEEFRPAIREAKRLMSVFADMEELIRLGAYRSGSDATVDEAIRLNEPMEAFLSQGKDEASAFADGFSELANLLEMYSTYSAPNSGSNE